MGTSNYGATETDLPQYPDLFGTQETPKFADQAPTLTVSSVLHSRNPLVRSAELKARRKVQFWNLIQTGLAYMFLLSSVQTALSIGTLVLNSVDDEKFHGTSTIGYTVLGVTYCVLAVAFWLSQPVVANIGPVNSMIISAVCFILFLVVFIRPLMVLIFIAAIVAGFGSAVLSTAGGVFMALNSDSETIGRNTGIFYGLYETSLVWGNVGFFLIMSGSVEISTKQRYLIFAFLLSLAVFGTILVLLLKRRQAASVLQPSEFARAIDRNFWDSMKAAIMLTQDPNVLYMTPLVIYLGLSSAFRNDIYNSSIGYTDRFRSLALVGMAGVFLGLGELTGSAICGAVSSKFPYMNRGKIVIGGVTFSVIAYIFIYLNLPSEANLGPTDGVSIISPPSKFVAVLCSFLMGIGDASINTQIYALLAEMFGRDIVPPVGLFQSVYAVFCAVAYFYSTSLKLYAQMLILIVLSVAGCSSFTIMAGRFARSRHFEDL
ncbi:UNC93-like protein MFSD11 isoform X2 [Paramacrobiotus metropolitanus]|uniref:UNC93-like protein MFSD11 isoform X2 n=1 Tax=Paramacrobiotus metropolitanus TaxID=2943436 RepID=UPI0024459A18|nr:UNC93-like protein MFSD11 isoform X2 [Paramacrobiotus metropolitanus]